MTNYFYQRLGKEWVQMKKIITAATAATLITAALFVGAISSSAYFGCGIEAVAGDVKLIKTGLLGQKLCFNDADFKSALCLTDFDTITVTEIPSSTEGTLLLGGKRVGKGRVIKRKNLGSLIFVPASGTVNEAKFKFTVDGYAGGAELECIMKFIDKVNYAPKIDEEAIDTVSLKTQEAISLYGTIKATDPEGDALEYIIVSYPNHGSFEFTDKTAGKYRYSPTDGYTGKDSFVYVARDEYGNYTPTQTVNIRIETRMCETVFLDMIDREEYNAAVAMAAMGVMDGRLIGDDSYFLPDEKVTRAEFVAMALKSAGIRADSTLTESYFDDDSEIPPSLRSYVATAQRLGIINGDFKDGSLIFAPNEEITKYEAAKIISSIIGSSDSGEESVFAENLDVPIWARAGVYTMCSLGIFTEYDTTTLSDTLTRADTANYLYKTIEKA